MWIAIAASGAMVALAMWLMAPAGRLLAAWEEYERSVEASRYHRHRQGKSVAQVLAEAAQRTRDAAATRYAPAPAGPAWADLVAA